MRRTSLVLRPDPRRVVARIFLPGQEITAAGRSRSAGVVERVLDLSDAEVEETLSGLRDSFDTRHRDLAATWRANADLLGHRFVGRVPPSPARRLLLGAYFTQEYAIESAALCNPSLVPHPDQRGVEVGATRLVMSVRAVGEGHISSIELRTGMVDAEDVVTFDPPPTTAVLPEPMPQTYSRDSFRRAFEQRGGHHEDADLVLGSLPETFTREDLDVGIAALREQRLTRGAGAVTVDRIERLAAGSYAVGFPTSSHIQERVLMPRAPQESHGMEDLRLVRRTDGADPAHYLGTYTAYDGRTVTPQLLRTVDFRRFDSEQLSGPGARDKGMAIFPRRVGGKHLSLTRADRESNSVTSSDDLRHWGAPVPVQSPRRPWEIVQLGNCGPPIETEAGWLVLTHGVGPMRRYGIGAMLLDIDDPTVVRGRLSRPLLTPDDEERSGYVPNVVYSCGAMLHGRTLLLPYGCSDSMIRLALVGLDDLLASLLAPPSH